LQRAQRGHRRGQQVQRPHRRSRQQRVEEQQRGQDAEPSLAPAQQHAAVKPVRQHPAIEPEHHQRDKLRHPEQAHGQRGAGELLGLDKQRDGAGLGPQQGNGAAAQQPAEVRGSAQRRKIHPQHAAVTLAAGSPREHPVFRLAWPGGPAAPGRRPPA
jgi:hypothetical protein